VPDLLTPCIRTKYALDKKGYGHCRVRRFGKWIWCDHILAWVDAHGRLPAPGMQINHHCDNRWCRNPEHVYEGTAAQNTKDMFARGRAHAQQITHCPHEHEYTPDNIYWQKSKRPDGAPGRVCKKCTLRGQRARYQQKRITRALDDLFTAGRTQNEQLSRTGS
jgi:HNH endonuclease